MTIEVVSGYVKHFCWYNNTWLDVYIKFFYTDSTYKLNPYNIDMKIWRYFKIVRYNMNIIYYIKEWICILVLENLCDINLILQFFFTSNRFMKGQSDIMLALESFLNQISH